MAVDIPLTDVTLEHRRGVRRCRCGKRHSRNEYLYLRDQRARIVHPGGVRAAEVSAWAAFRHTPPVPSLPQMRIDELQRRRRLHSPDPTDPYRCLSPTCDNGSPCITGVAAEAELLAAGVALWMPR
jgi:hypothetical protein